MRKKMKELNLFNFYYQTKEMNILLQFKGALSQEILLEMSDMINKQSNFAKSIKSSFSVFVELSQNIMKYSSEKEIIKGDEIGVGIILFIEEDKIYKIYSGNSILNINKEGIINKLDKIKSATHDELKTMYKEQRRKGPEENSRGAGLGFIDIARKASSVDYEIRKVDKNNSFLIVKVVINKESE
jgi:hypothetical protein